MHALGGAWWGPGLVKPVRLKRCTLVHPVMRLAWASKAVRLSCEHTLLLPRRRLRGLCQHHALGRRAGRNAAAGKPAASHPHHSLPDTVKGHSLACLRPSLPPNLTSAASNRQLEYRMAALHGRFQVIGFDMGGTSTDVSRYAGAYEHVFESTTAGVTIQARACTLLLLPPPPPPPASARLLLSGGLETL